MHAIQRAAVLLAILTIPAAVAACGSTGPEDGVVFDYDFNVSDHGFEGSFSDVAVDQVADVAFVSDRRALPSPLSGQALYQSGVNISDDLFMFITRRVTGLEPGAGYRATFFVELATAYGEDCTIGVGAGVLVKAGAAGEAVERVVVTENATDYYVLTVDKGNQASEGSAAVILGDLRNGLPGCGGDIPYDRETVEASGKSVIVTADQDGAVWLFLGTESTFESPHEQYFTRFRAELTPAD